MTVLMYKRSWRSAACCVQAWDHIGPILAMVQVQATTAAETDQTRPAVGVHGPAVSVVRGIDVKDVF